MKYVAILIFPFFLASCSATWKSEFLMLVPVEGALNVDLYNWETELYGGPSFGHVRPEMYGYKLGDAYYFIYPREISSSGTMGPPLIPLGLSTPETKNNKHSLFILRVFDPKSNYPVKPMKMSILNGSNLQASCNLIESFQDAVGIEYKCSQEQIFPNTPPSKVVVKFSNQLIIEFPVKSVVVSGYSPLFSFNGPNPKPKIVIYGDSGEINYPK